MRITHEIVIKARRIQSQIKAMKKRKKSRTLSKEDEIILELDRREKEIKNLNIKK